MPEDTLFNQMNASLRSINAFMGQVLGTLRRGFQTLNNTLNIGFKTLAQFGAIGSGSGKLWKSVGLNPVKGKGGSAGMGAINDYISALFSGSQIFGNKPTRSQSSVWDNPVPKRNRAPAYRGSDMKFGEGILTGLSGFMKPLLAPFKLAGKVAGKAGGAFMGMGGGTGAVMGGLGASLMASFGPLGILLQLLSPLIEAFLEPLDMLTPIMESMGTILSQFLVPIMLLLMDILTPFMPVIISLTNALMPIVELLVSILMPLMPLILLLAELLDLIFKAVGWVTTLVSGLGYWPQKVSVFIQEAIDRIKERFTQGWGDILTDAMAVLREKLMGAFSNIKQKSEDFWDRDEWWNVTQWGD